jgi:hypothetical protein
MKATKPCPKCGCEKPFADYTFRRGKWAMVCRECLFAGIEANDRVFSVDENGHESKRKRRNDF